MKLLPVFRSPYFLKLLFLTLLALPSQFPSWFILYLTFKYCVIVSNGQSLVSFICILSQGELEHPVTLNTMYVLARLVFIAIAQNFLLCSPTYIHSGLFDVSMNMCHGHIKCVKWGCLITSLILLFLHKSFPSLTFLVISLVAQVRKLGVIIDFFPSFLIFNFSVSLAVSAFIIFLHLSTFLPCIHYHHFLPSHPFITQSYMNTCFVFFSFPLLLTMFHYCYCWS